MSKLNSNEEPEETLTGSSYCLFTIDGGRLVSFYIPWNEIGDCHIQETDEACLL